VGDNSVGPLAEYAALREDLRSRDQYQRQLINLQLTLAAGTLAFVVAHAELEGLFLAIPVATYFLCGRWVAQHTGMEQIVDYIMNDLSPRIPGGVRWDAWSMSHLRPRRVQEFIVPIIAIFPGLSLSAIVTSVWLSVAQKSTLGLGPAAFAVVLVLDILVSVMSCILAEYSRAGRFMVPGTARKDVPMRPAARSKDAPPCSEALRCSNPEPTD
jgi:hypothetical protein